MSFLEWLTEFIGKFSSHRPGGKAWNPVPIGAYADYIIQQMGATPAQIQKHIENVVEPEVEKDIPFVYIPDINGNPTKGHYIDKTTGQLYTQEQWGLVGPIYTALKKGEITEDEAYNQIGQVPNITGQSPTTEQDDDEGKEEEEEVDISDDDTTKDLVDDTTDDTSDDDTTDDNTTTDPSEPKTNVWRDALEQWRKEARERAKEQERIEQEKLAERRREKGYDDLSNTGKSIFDKMVEMGLDPNVTGIQHSYTGYGDYGRPNYRNISRFFSNYNTWRAEKAKEKTARRNSQLTDVSTAGDTAVTFEGKTYTYDTDKGYWSVSEGDLLETSILYHINKDTGETDDLRPDTDGDGIRDPDDAAPENPDVQTQEQLDKIEQDRLDEIEQDRLDEWNAGDADDDGVLNKDDNNDFLLSSFVGEASDANKDSDGDGIPDWADPFPEDARKGLGEAGNFGFEWTTKDGRKIIIPIFGGGGSEGLNVNWEDGQTRVTIGIMEEGVLVEHDIGSMEEVADKINNAVNEGKTTIDEIQETTLDVLKNIFGPKEEEDETIINPIDSIDPPETIIDPIDSIDPPENIVDPIDSIDPPENIVDPIDSIDPPENIVDPIDPNLDNVYNTDRPGSEKTIIDTDGPDPYENIIETETSVSPSLASGGGLFQGTTAEALGRFMPKEIVQPVPFARRAAAYKRPRYSLFSEYI